MSSTSSKTSRPAYDPRRLREIFDGRAAAFDEVAFLPREIAERMRERLEYIKVAPVRVRDARARPRRRSRRRRCRRGLAPFSPDHARQGLRRARPAARAGGFLGTAV